MAASTASWTMLFGFVAIVLPPAPSWSRRYVPAYTTFLLKKRHPCLITPPLRSAPTFPRVGSQASDMSRRRKLGRVTRDRWFESGFLHRRVRKLSVPLGDDASLRCSGEPRPARASTQFAVPPAGLGRGIRKS